ncbi:hypothetical protein OEZ85_002008 [Tetradesmus obliquus]|uniref:Uncharacterized protein n=1 Tax=Tetradesmus obliquus TaxID=3088 RepID=A0ABY8U1L5_TETOB|nr:hypothetical protein OEZ85_002008 [Tetradesmus obliquus]
MLQHCTVRRLERELLKKQQESDELEQQNNLLRIRDGILTGYSINLAWLRDHAAGESGAGSLASAFSHDTSAEEMKLLDQLQGLSIHAALGPRLRPGPSAAAAAAAPGAAGSGGAAAPGCSLRDMLSSTLSASSNVREAQPLAPAGDPLYLLRHICCMPPFPGAASMTEQQLAAEYAASVQQLALQLSLYRAEQQVPPVLSACSMRHETPVQKMQDIISRIQRMRATLALSGRSDLLRLQYIVSCEDPARMLPEPSIEQHTRALELLGLSRQQQQRLADGYMQLDEQQQQQQQLHS